MSEQGGLEGSSGLSGVRVKLALALLNIFLCSGGIPNLLDTSDLPKLVAPNNVEGVGGLLAQIASSMFSSSPSRRLSSSGSLSDLTPGFSVVGELLPLVEYCLVGCSGGVSMRKETPV